MNILTFFLIQPLNRWNAKTVGLLGGLLKVLKQGINVVFLSFGPWIRKSGYRPLVRLLYYFKRIFFYQQLPFPIVVRLSIRCILAISGKNHLLLWSQSFLRDFHLGSAGETMPQIYHTPFMFFFKSVSAFECNSTRSWFIHIITHLT